MDYDVIVIGGGPAGEHCLGALADGGLRVALVERELVGGECSYWGCIPSKTLLRPGEAIQAAHEAPGANAGPIDPAAALAWRDFMVSSYDDAGQAAWLKTKRADLLRGEGRSPAPGVVEVGGRRTRPTHRRSHRIGCRSSRRSPDFASLEGVWTNREATALTEIPRRLIVLGGGAVGVELAQAIHRLGADVVLVEGMDHLLPREAPALGLALGDALRAEGVELRLGRHAAAGAPGRRGLRGGLRRRRRAARRPPARRDRPPRPHRRPRTRDRRHRADASGIPVESAWPPPRTSGRSAMSPASGRSPTSASTRPAWPPRTSSANRLAADYRAVPRVIFTDPQVAAVGAESGALTATVSLADVPRTSTYTRAYAERPGSSPSSPTARCSPERYAVGPEAGEWLQQATLAISARIPLAVLLETIQPFPTFSESFLFGVLELNRDVRTSLTRPAVAA